ncbi:MAG: hypothetical protein FWH01_01975 [Oscillospiraceae bacterium]|nr:hypothetical protein [Oscillospiraceae bacterium]
MKKRVVSMLLVCSILFLMLPANVFAAETVTNFAQLKAALENPSIDVINFGANIAMERDRNIIISPNKTGLTINGNGYQLVQNDYLSGSYAIQFDCSKSNIQHMVFNNLYLSGQTRKGFLNIPNNPRNPDFTVVFNNVKYDGPELISARYSNVVLNNCEILVTPTTTDANGYFVTGTNITLSGDVKFTKQSETSNRTLFYVYNKGALTIASRANVVIQNETDQRVAKKAGFANFMTSVTKLVFEDYSSFEYYGTSAFLYGADVGEVHVGRSANVFILVVGNLSNTNGLLGIKSSMTVNNEARVYIIAASNTNAYPVIRIAGASSFTFNSPREVLIYNASWKTNGNGLAIYVPTAFTFTFNDIREVDYYQLSRSPYNSLGTPTYRFANDNGSMYSVSYGMNSPLFSAYSLKVLSSYRYTGSTPFTSASLKDMNIIRISNRSSSGGITD